MKVYTVQEALEAAKKKLRDTEAERDALAASTHLLNKLIEAMQNAATEYLLPDGDTNGFINRVIYLLDGPEQRAAQAAPKQCLRDVQAEAGRAGYYEGFKAGILVERPALPQQNAESAVDYFKLMTDRIAEVNADKYAATVRQGGAE